MASNIDPDAFAKKTFILTMIACAMYALSVYAFVLTDEPSGNEAAEAIEHD